MNSLLISRRPQLAVLLVWTSIFSPDYLSPISFQEKVICERLQEVTIILATTRVLLGMDFHGVDIIIFASPFNEVGALLQGGGRGGRRRPDGRRGLVQVYQLFNTSDIGANTKVTNMMVQLCRDAESNCTTSKLRAYYSVPSLTNTGDQAKGSWCCHNCDITGS